MARTRVLGQVAGRGDGGSDVTVHLSFGERTVEGRIQEDSSPGRNPLEESLSAALESIRGQFEEGNLYDFVKPKTRARR